MITSYLCMLFSFLKRLNRRWCEPMKTFAGFFFAITLLLFSGCSPRTSVSTIMITDPDAGGVVDVLVGSNGEFSKETKGGNFVSLVSGSIRDDTQESSSVKLVYERKIKSDTSRVKTEKIETTFTAQADVEVPIGRNPSDSNSNESTTGRVTAMLIKGK
jgi:hypothetical protein